MLDLLFLCIPKMPSIARRGCSKTPVGRGFYLLSLECLWTPCQEALFMCPRHEQKEESWQQKPQRTTIEGDISDMKPGMVPPPPGEESQTVILPPGWHSYLSPQGRRYYVNTTTNVNGYHASGTPAHPPEAAHMSLRKSTGDSQINCVTFPHPDTMPEQQLLKPTEWSYCDYFWADKKDPQGNGTVAGFELLLQKQLKGKQMQKEMSEFIRERIKIEEEYAKNLAKLSQNSLAAQEE
ncbi:hypothetical protein A6R68_09554, partial [Neotoma lepida]